MDVEGGSSLGREQSPMMNFVALSHAFEIKSEDLVDLKLSDEGGLHQVELVVASHLDKLSLFLGEELASFENGVIVRL